MDKSKQIKDVQDLKSEMDFIEKQFQSFDNKMLAVAMDYKFYLDPRIKDNTIYKIRDSIIYRLNCSKFHFQILLNIITHLDLELTNAYRKLEKKNNPMGLSFHFDQRALHINYLSDSIFFHLGSGFDYLSNLVEYICSKNKNTEFKWGQLAKSARDSKNPFSQNLISKAIDKLDREFVGKLYDHRSYLIHTSVDKSPSSFSINIMEAECETHIFSSVSFNKRFKELKKESETFNLTIQYSLLWIIKKSIDSLIEILFGLKDYMESNRKIKIPFMFIKGQNGEMLPPSLGYWGEKTNKNVS
jgi:hypothetical protein